MPPQMQPILQPDRCLQLAVNQLRTLQSLHFIDNPSLDGVIGDDEVEIEVFATGISFRDIMIILRQIDTELLGESSDTVTSVGCNSRRKFSPGDRVYYWHKGAHKTRVRAPASVTQHIPETMSFAEAASLLMLCHTVYYSLVTITKLQKDESVLIHAGAGHIGQTAIRLALHIGAVVYITAGSDQKKQLPIDNFGIPKSHIFSTRDTEFGNSIREVTGGVGIDVILDSLARRLLAESLGVLAPFGRFVELGKVDVVGSSRMDIAVVQPSVSFTYVDLVQLFHCKLKVAADLSLEVQHLVETGIFLPPAPLHIYPISQIKYAFRHFQSRVAGKVVLSYGVADKVRVIPRNIECKSLSPEGTYVVAGGQGGLGREICSWMARPGAKSIVILSPSGSTNASTQELIEELGRRGTGVRAISCNISSREQLDFVLAVCRQELPPIRGLIQAALASE
ncbi:hypothetical protein BDV36DRAFT_906 [Aspergillus pseudocaelatus]|uniref:Enoyl reductase (ER) domain-containing protein n=1 Tax=Aspergillus pseudocaelatus TaxID=1825620 RepID=A0ABQ6X6F0_9EURO|nr:hypothetical protein BDV36DRAFT_906 [Aspergillus pseudocaelatus]